ncbi:MAG TPA: hypothetical protein VGQ64_00380 [Candidatus Limnocylindrales bacterium]|jgi:hypothetical protein|nr:hypothetical protein [Candidatus Limnocylindrales bacterium]
MTRRGLGAILIAVGLLVTAAGAIGFVSSGGARTATASPTAGLPTETPFDTPTPAPTPDPEALVRAFTVDLAAQIRDGTQAELLDALDPAVIARYGRDACRSHLTSFPPDPTYSIVVNGVADPAPWDYASDGKATTIGDAVAVDTVVTGGGTGSATPSSATRTLHFHVVDGVVRWFIDCGTPLA